MGYKKFSYIDIRGGQIKPHWTHRLLLLVGLLLRMSAIYIKSPVRYHGNLTSLWEAGEVLLVPRLLMGKLTSSGEPLAYLSLNTLEYYNENSLIKYNIILSTHCQVQI